MAGIECVKPQSPILFRGLGISPLTYHDQIIMPDGSRWDGTISGSSALDTTLKESGKAADAGAVGEALTQLKEKNAA